MKKLFLALIFILFASNVYAVDVYIRDGASGTGTSWANALDDLPSTLVRGYTYYIADGSYGDWFLGTAVSGETYITIKKATQSSHGSDSTTWSNTYGDGQATINSVKIYSSYWKFDGAVGSLTDDATKYGFYFYRASTSAVLTYIGLISTGYHNYDADYVEISHCAFVMPGAASYDYYQQGIQSNPFNYTSSHITVSDCYFYNGQNGMSIRDWDDSTIQRCYFKNNAPGATTIKSQQITLGNGHDRLTIKDNIFVNTYYAVLGLHRQEGTDVNTYIYFYNNTMIGNTGADGAGILVDADSSRSDNLSNWYAHHNTTVNFVFSANGFFKNGTITNPTASMCYSYNNLFYNCSGTVESAGPRFTGTAAAHTHTDNVFYSCSGTYDNSEGGTAIDETGDPFIYSAGKNYHLDGTDAAAMIDKGKTLGSPYNTDRDSVSRPQGSGYDAGAFEYVTSSPTTYTLTVSTTGGGAATITSDPAGINCGSTCSYAFTADSTVTLTCTPTGDDVFYGWVTGCSGTGTCDVLMNGNKTVIADVRQPDITYYTLTVTKTGDDAENGLVTADVGTLNCGTDCDEEYVSGTEVKLTGTPGSSGGGTDTLGVEATGTLYSPTSGILYLTSPEVATYSGTFTKIRIYGTCTTSSAIKLGIYKGATYSTSTLVGMATFTPGVYTESWHEYDVSAEEWECEAGQTYWCAYQPATAANFTVGRNSGSATNGYYVAHTYADAWPDPFGAATAQTYVRSINAEISYGEATATLTWSGDGSGTGSVRTVTMSDDMDVTATFGLIDPPDPDDADVVDPNANDKTQAVYDYLVGLPEESTNKLLSGQMECLWEETSAFTGVYNLSGLYPAILGEDFAADYAIGTLLENAIAHSDAGGIVTFSYHMPNPATGGTASDTTTVDFDALVSYGSSLNSTLRSMLDPIADYFNELEDEDVVVLWRPYHEINGSWFWWGTGTTEQIKELWRYTFNYLTTTKGCHNLIWVYSAAATPYFRTVDSCYPGNDYVDITGLDYYGNYTMSTVAPYFNTLAALGKPVALTEFGPCDSGASTCDASDYRQLVTNIASAIPDCIYWMSWCQIWGMDEHNYIDELMDMSTVVDRSEVDISVPTYHTVTVTKAGTGNGLVTSSPVGIDYGSVGSYEFLEGTTITLSATPLDGGTFSGWSNGCTGTGDCVISEIAADAARTATFAKADPPPTPSDVRVISYHPKGVKIKSRPVITASTIDSYPESNFTDYFGLANGFVTRYAQSITGNGSELNKVKWYLFSSLLGSITGNAVCKLYSHSGTFGTSSVAVDLLATSENYDVSSLSNIASLVTFNFLTPYTLVNGTKYVISIEYSGGDETHLLYVGSDITSPTHGGNMVSYGNPDEWSPQPNYDLIFYAINE